MSEEESTVSEVEESLKAASSKAGGYTLCLIPTILTSFQC
jgi:hypothetical protein